MNSVLDKPQFRAILKDLSCHSDELLEWNERCSTDPASDRRMDYHRWTPFQKELVIEHLRRDCLRYLRARDDISKLTTFDQRMAAFAQLAVARKLLPALEGLAFEEGEAVISCAEDVVLNAPFRDQIHRLSSSQREATFYVINKFDMLARSMRSNMSNCDAVQRAAADAILMLYDEDGVGYMLGDSCDGKFFTKATYILTYHRKVDRLRTGGISISGIEVVPDDEAISVANQQPSLDAESQAIRGPMPGSLEWSNRKEEFMKEVIADSIKEFIDRISAIQSRRDGVPIEESKIEKKTVMSILADMASRMNGNG